MELVSLISICLCPIFHHGNTPRWKDYAVDMNLHQLKPPEGAMPVVTTRVTSQNGGLATVVVGIAAPTASGLAINVQ